jgi:hypothetical protein
MFAVKQFSERLFAPHVHQSRDGVYQALVDTEGTGQVGPFPPPTEQVFALGFRGSYLEEARTDVRPA